MKPLFFLAALMIASPSLGARPRTFLLSLSGLQLGPKEYVDSFSIDTWGVEILATCHMPPGWTITAGSSADPTGTIAGEASLGVTFLDRSRLRYLTRIVLIRTDEPIRRHAGRHGELPPTFAGTADIGTYGPSGTARKQTLDFRNVRLTPVLRCPSPRTFDSH